MPVSVNPLGRVLGKTLSLPLLLDNYQLSGAYVNEPCDILLDQYLAGLEKVPSHAI